tara:strand:+ start:300 stop:503 length:204 start_codon:yes stop_codon:yes gene_type:complete
MAKKKLTIDLDKMNDGFDGVTGTDYQWQIVDDPKGNPKHCYSIKIYKHMIKSGQRFTEVITQNGKNN